MHISRTFSFARALAVGALVSSQCVGSSCEVQKLTASDATAAAGFGSAVSLDGDIAVVGAPWSDDACPEDPLFCNSGSAYLFRRNGNTWVQEQKLTASDARAQEEFGDSVAVSGQTIVVGTPGGCTAEGCTPGWAYVFGHDGSTWVEEQKLRASDPAAFIQFGHSVSISGDVVFVGAQLVRLVRRGQWRRRRRGVFPGRRCGGNLWFGIPVPL